MDARLVWTLALVVLNGGLLWPLLRRRPVIVPLAQPLAFLACEIVSLQWLFQGSWTTGARWTALACFVFVGCLLIQQAFGRRRWFVFRGGGFTHDMDTYDALALAIRQTLSDESLPPATVICRYDGWIGLTPLDEDVQARFVAHLDDALEDTRWRRFGLWQLFFGIQGAVLVLALLRQFLEIHGGL